MTVLVAGGAGFTGSYLVRALARRGERVVVFSRAPNALAFSDVREGVSFARGDVSSAADVIQAVKDHGVTDVYHLVALLGDVSQQQPLAASRVNTDSTLNFLEAARLVGLRRIVFASSVAVYDPQAEVPVTESAPLRPASVYGQTKVTSEFFGMHYHRAFGVDFRALRLTTLYGRGKSGGSTGICSLMIEQSARGEPVTVDAADAVTDWLYVKDAVHALLLARDAESPKTRIYNVGAGAYSLRQVADIVRQVLPRARLELRSERTFPWPARYDCSKARDELGFTPRYDIERGIRDFVADVQTHP